jgi:F-type H+-transporting ATPase subunit epsilon
MKHTLAFSVVTPDRVVYQAEIKEATIPTKDGEITVLANHAPLVSLLSTGEMRVKKDGDNEVSFAISGGVLEVRPGSELIILTDFAEHAAEIDLEEAEKARLRAEELLQREETMSKEDIAHFESMLEREIIRLRVGEKYRRR